MNDETIALIRRRTTRPFAIFLAHHAPHSPLQAPAALVKKYRERLGQEASEAVVITFDLDARKVVPISETARALLLDQATPGLTL